MLSRQQVAHYQEHGWIAPIQVLNSGEADQVLDALTNAEAAYPEDLNSGNRNNAHLVLPFLADLAIHPVILACVASLINQPTALLNSVLFIKEPEGAEYVSWHQDGTYMGVDSTDMVTAWLALTHSTSNNGCVAMASGSHQDGIRPHSDHYGADNILTRGQNVEGFDADSAVDIVLAPGQMSLHHPHLIHGSGPNRSTGRRVGVAFQSYIGAAVRPSRGKHYALPVGDTPVDPAFVVVPHPEGELTNHARTLRAAANAALSDVLYYGAAERRSY
ncbi:MAG: phytanoyl-CoA dioxygenase family protein [Acidimicrobiales bacterium]|nr:phytanoyl-CoA dioxygenase family protein [Acidimicrobiales bacterium]